MAAASKICLNAAKEGQEPSTAYLPHGHMTSM